MGAEEKKLDGSIQVDIPVVFTFWLAGVCLILALVATGWALWQRAHNEKLERQRTEEHGALESLLHGIEVLVPQDSHLASMITGTESGKGYPLLKCRAGAYSMSRKESSLIVSIAQKPSAEVRPLHSTAQQVDHGGKVKAAGSD